MRFGLSVAILLMLPAPAIARAPSIPAADAPELAALGPHPVGVRDLTLVDPARAGLTGVADRSLALLVWYPAARSAAPRTYRRELPRAGRPPVMTTTEAIATSDAVPAGGRFPLVIVSHGFGGWPAGMSYLTENLASKGYVVVSIAHRDDWQEAAGRLVSFGNAVVNRAADQQAVLREMVRRAGLAGDPVGRHVDADRVAVVGYSMGGFGALATGGAGYDPDGATPKQIPGGLLAPQLQGVRVADPRLKAIVAIAPWGGQPANRSWSLPGLAGLKLPSLFIAGDADDVSIYRDGIRWLWENAANSDRWLLTYANARHNVGGNPIPREVADDPDFAENFAEPVWRSDRLNAVNLHFITAFLDRYVKGDTRRARYLDVPFPDAGAATWPTTEAAPRFAEGSPTYWDGFQKRWLVGLKLERRPPQH